MKGKKQHYDILATESALVIGNLNFLCNSTCKKLDYVAVNRSIDSLGNGLVSCSADLCYCNKSRNVRINVRITTVCTCVSCITLSVKCRSSYNYIVAVTKSVNMICNVAVTTVTGVGCVTCSLTGRSGYNCVVRVTCSRNYYLSYLIVTSCTVRAFGKTEFGTGRINCSIGNHIVAECINLICNVAITTLCTSVGCVTCILTSRIGYNRIIGVTKSRSKLCATYCTSLCSSTSSLCACGMTVRGNYLLSYLMVASCTVRAFGKTCLGTSRSLCCIGNHIVTECINLICNVAIATICTGICCITAVFTIGLSYNCLIIVTECINLVCNVAFATYTGVGCVTAVYTVGSSNSCIIVMNVKSNTKCAVLVCLTVEAVCTVVGYVVSKATAADLKSSLAICVSLVTVNCTNKLTAYNISSTAYDTLVAGKVVVPVVNCKCRILIGCTVIYDVTTLNSKSAVYTNGNLLICGDSTLALNSKSLVDTNKYERIARVIVITLSGRNCVTVKIKNKCTCDLACVSSLNIDVLSCLNISKKSDCITAYCCIKCSLKSLVLNVADLCNIGYRNYLVCAVNTLSCPAAQ